jgi:hypothetical protein
MGNERREHTLQSTALVHEAYERLINLKDVSWQNRAHFFGVSAQLMRRILVDYARSRRYSKRGANGATSRSTKLWQCFKIGGQTSSPWMMRCALWPMSIPEKPAL